MPKEQRLTWGGNLQAQQEADAAFAKLRDRQKKKPAAKAQKPKRRHSGEQKQFKGTYADYLRSPQWQKRRRKALDHYGRKCTICRSADNLEVHHRHYRTVFHEGWPDLDVLCRDCHQNHHEGDKPFIYDSMTAEFLAIAGSAS